MPTSPNYKKNLGRLVTDRYDFESHINGSDLKHKAKDIILDPTLVIGQIPNTTTANNIQEALNNIVTIVNTPLPEATLFQKGIIRLSGDISDPNSTSYNIIVSGIRGRSISNTSPADGQILTWDGGSFSWTPKDPILFSAGGDLRGTNNLQYVHQLTGNSDQPQENSEVNILAKILKFDAINFDRYITQADKPNGTSSANIIIRAQSALTGSTYPDVSGGYVNIQGGSAKGTSQPGGVLITVDGRDNPSVLLEAVKLSVSKRFLTLLGHSKLSSSDVSNINGDMFIYIKETPTIPIGSPITGAILYSKNGRLYLTEGDNSDNISGKLSNFPIGSIPEEMMWGNSSFGTFSKKYFSQSVAIASLVESFSFPADTSVKIDAVCVGRSTSNNETYQVNMAVGYSVDSNGLPILIGNTTYSDERTNGSISAPYFSINNSNVEIYSGYDNQNANEMNWIIVLQITYMQGPNYI